MHCAHGTAFASVLCMALLATGCAPASRVGDDGARVSAFTDAVPLPSITGTQWSCTEVADATGSLVAVTGEPPTLLIGADAKVSGFAGVNRYFSTAAFASVMAPPIPLKFGPIGATRMAGPPERMELESAFTSMLARVSFAQVVGGAAKSAGRTSTPADAALVLSGDAGILARFTPSPADSASAP